MLSKGKAIKFGQQTRISSTVKEIAVEGELLPPLDRAMNDDRAEGFETASRTNAEIETTVRECLSNANITVEPDDFAQIANAVKDVNRIFRNMRDDALVAGRKLLKLRDEHPKVYAELFRMVNGKCAMPFSPATATRMCSVAEFVDSGKVPHDKLPVAHSAAYEIVLLDSHGLLPAALKDGLIESTTTRSAVIEWRRNQSEPQENRLEMLQTEKRRLQQRIAKLDKEIERLVRRSESEEKHLAKSDA